MRNLRRVLGSACLALALAAPSARAQSEEGRVKAILDGEILAPAVARFEISRQLQATGSTKEEADAFALQQIPGPP